MVNISVIIPVYNAEKTIFRCLESLLSSKYESFEIILIDYGSTDSTLSIISKFSENDSRIKFYIQENGGPSKARNRGIKLASGRIIAFVDSDDYVREDYLEKITKHFEDDIDVLFFEFCRVNNNGEILSKHELPIFQNNKYYENIIELSRKDMFGYTWVKAFSRDLINNKWFDESIRLYEDEVFTCQVLKERVKLRFLNECLYFYVRGEESLANKVYDDYGMICDKVYEAWLELLENYNDKSFLYEKCNHFAKVCKYYGLEKKINPIKYFYILSNTVYINQITIEDSFLEAIRSKKWIKVFLSYLIYRIRLFIRQSIRRNNER